MSIAVTGLPCAWHASTKPSSDAKLMLNAPRIFEYLRMPIPLTCPAAALDYRERGQCAKRACQSNSGRLRMDGTTRPLAGGCLHDKRAPVEAAIETARRESGARTCLRPIRLGCMAG